MMEERRKKGLVMKKTMEEAKKVLAMEEAGLSGWGRKRELRLEIEMPDNGIEKEDGKIEEMKKNIFSSFLFFFFLFPFFLFKKNQNRNLERKKELRN